MEGNACDDGVIVPPRKRLLAGFKKLNSNSDQSCGSSASPPLNGTDADERVKNLLGSYTSASGGYSLEEVVDRANEAALAAAKVAEAARTVSEEKAAIAAKAIASAKTALDLVAKFHEESMGRHRRTKKSKSKRWVAVHSVNKKRVEDENNVTDEEELRQVIYRTHGLSKHSPPSSDFKHKQPKILIEKTNIPSGRIFDGDS